MFVPPVNLTSFPKSNLNVSKNPKFCFFLHGKICEEQDDFTEAEKCYLEYLKDHPNDSKALSHLAYVRSKLPEKQYPVTYTERYRYETLFWTEGFSPQDKIKMSRDPEVQDLYFWIVLCQHLQSGFFPLASISRLLHVPLPEPHYIEYIVSIFSIGKKRDEIIDKFMKSLIHRTEAKIAKHLAWYFVKWGDLENAAIAVSHLPIDDDNFHIFLRAKVLEMQGKVREAKALYLTMKNICEPLKYAERLKALEFFNDPSYQSELSIAYSKFPKDPDIATAHALLEENKSNKLTRLKEISQKNPWHYYSKLKFYEISEKFELYLITISKQIEELPHAHNLRVKRIQIALKTKTFLKEAEEDCKILLDSGKSGIRKDYLEVLLLKKDYRLIAKVAGQVLFSEPLNARAYYLRALAYSRLGEKDQALSMIEILAQMGPLKNEEKILADELGFHT